MVIETAIVANRFHRDPVDVAADQNLIHRQFRNACADVVMEIERRASERAMSKVRKRYGRREEPDDVEDLD